MGSLLGEFDYYMIFSQYTLHFLKFPGKENMSAKILYQNTPV